jgi:hypothetical protein
LLLAFVAPTASVCGCSGSSSTTTREPVESGVDTHEAPDAGGDATSAPSDGGFDASESAADVPDARPDGSDATLDGQEGGSDSDATLDGQQGGGDAAIDVSEEGSDAVASDAESVEASVEDAPEQDTLAGDADDGSIDSAADAMAPLCQAQAWSASGNPAIGGTDPVVPVVGTTNIYWSAADPVPGTHDILRAPLTVAGTSVLATAGAIGAFALDSSALYYVNDGSNPNTVVARVSLADGSTTILGSTAVVGGGSSIAIDATSVYWTGGLGGVWKVPIVGGTPVVVSSGGSPSNITVDTARLYWTDGGSVLSMALADGTPVALAAGQNGPSYLVVDATNAYWANTGDGTIIKVSLSGGSPVTLASGYALLASQAPYKTGSSGLTISSGSVAWMTADGSVYSVPKNGGPTVFLASAYLYPLTCPTLGCSGQPQAWAQGLAADSAGNLYAAVFQWSGFGDYVDSYLVKISCPAPSADP